MSRVWPNALAAIVLTAVLALAHWPWLCAPLAATVGAALIACRQRLAADAVAAGFLALAALTAPWLTPFDPNGQFETAAGHVLGLDRSGRDIFARALYGLRYTGFTAAVGAGLAVLIGAAAGGAMALCPRWARRAFDMFLQAFLSIPALIYFFLGLAFLEPGPQTLIVLFALTLWPETARMAQARAVELAAADFAQVARMQGYGSVAIYVREIAPNLGPVLAAGFLTATASAALLEAILGYLGLGFGVGAPSLGRFLEESVAALDRHPWSLALGLAILTGWIAALRGLLKRLDRAGRPLAVG